jgi:hypothetical protein
MYFKVAETGTLYLAERIDAQSASWMGCPNATHRITGPHTKTVHYGHFENSGKPKGGSVRVKFNGEIDGYLYGV